MPGLTIESVNNTATLFGQNIQDYKTFVETGTSEGHTIQNLHRYFEEIHTIEVSDYFYRKFINNSKHLENVKSHIGDSSFILPNILKDLRHNTIFWLDAHFSSGNSGRSEKDVPLIEELNAIDSNYMQDKALIIIDDYRMFGSNRNEDWSDITKENILNCFTNSNRYTIKQHNILDDRLNIFIELL